MGMGAQSLSSDAEAVVLLGARDGQDVVFEDRGSSEDSMDGLEDLEGFSEAKNPTIKQLAVGA